MDYILTRSYLFLLSLLVGLGCSWLSIRIARRAGLIDVPGSMPHKRHAIPTPLAGGIALFVSMLLLSPLLGSWNDLRFTLIIISVSVIFLFGLLDDRFGFSAPVKLAGQGAAVLIVVVGGISVRFLESTEFYMGGPLWPYQVADWVLTAVWLIGITNAFNLVDSMDGLALGLAGNGLLFLSIGTFLNQQSLLNAHLLSMLGVCSGILFFNTKPARLFLGDSGAQSLGFLLAVFCILFNPVVGWQASSWFFPILVVGVPIFDTCLVVYSRLKRGKPFYRSQLDHTYHRLVRAGLSSRRAVTAIIIVSLLLGATGYLALQSSALVANLIFLGCLAAGAAGILILERPVFTGEDC